MRFFYLAIVLLFAAATAIFAAQNFQTVTVSVLSVGANIPLAFLVAIIYLLGAVTGGGLLAILRRSIAGARGHRG